MKENNLYVPNLFDYEKEELTQDAFISWLLQWADKRLEKTNKTLHLCACDLLELFIGEKIEVTSMEVYKRFENIDLWFIINTNTILIIEDKTFSIYHVWHDKKLEIYKKTAENWCKDYLKSYKLNCVYYKMEDYKYSETEYVSSSGFKAVNRKDILAVLKKYYISANNDVIKDYYLYLSNIENTYNEVFEKTFDEIKHSEDDLMIYMKGFCAYYTDKIKADWDFINKPSNPYVAMFWNWQKLEHGEVFLQFENFDLKIKIYLDDSSLMDHQTFLDIKNKTWKKIEKLVKEKGYKISRPSKVTNGRTITVALIDEDMWLTKDTDGKIDKEGTLQKLLSLNTIIDEIVSN